MSEDLREERIGEVQGMLTEYERRGMAVWVSEDGTKVAVVGGSAVGDDDVIEEAFEEFLWDHRMLHPYRAELEGLTKTQEGREILLEAYRRFQAELEEE